MPRLGGASVTINAHDIYELLLSVQHALNTMTRTVYFDENGDLTDTYMLATRVDAIVAELKD
jgi:hypothetical protein